jgi:alpha-1,2-mannosyltransferase
MSLGNPTARTVRSDTAWKCSIILSLISLYAVIFYYVLHHQIWLDFSSLYSAVNALQTGDNPYQTFLTTYLPVVEKVPANLNPPFTLWLFSFFSQFHYDDAVAVWCVLSFILGVMGAGFGFSAVFSFDFLKKNWIYCFAFYLCLFSTLVNTCIAQFGSIVLFFVMAGYYCYLKKYDVRAGLLWGVIISIKLFPGLLLLFAFAQKRYRVCVTLCLTLTLLCLLPLLSHGGSVYSQYFAMMSRVLWYADNWNGSLYGYLSRVFLGASNPTDLRWINPLYLTLGFGMLLVYWSQMRSLTHPIPNHPSFGLTLIVMLLLSPFGWFYYYPLLLLPLAITGRAMFNQKANPIQTRLLWLLCLLLTNFPAYYIHSHATDSLINRLTLYSFHFYGLLLLLYLIHRTKKNNPLILPN